MSTSELHTKLEEVQNLQLSVMEDICTTIDKIDLEKFKGIKGIDVNKLSSSQKLRYVP